MDLQVLSRTNYEVASSKNKSSKAKTQNNSNKTHGKAPRGKNNNNSNFIFQPNLIKQKSDSYPSWNVFNGSRSSNKANFGKSEVQKSQNLHLKNVKNNYSKGYSSDKNFRSMNPILSSDSDGSGSSAHSVLSGFKVVQGGKTLHDETAEDLEESIFMASLAKERVLPMEISSRFASSEMTVGPNFKMISLPMFLQVEQSVVC